MKKLLINVGMTLGVALLLWGALHVFLSPVNPKQEVPKGHFGGACWACHFVSEGAEIVTE